MTIRDLTRHTAGFATGADNPGVGPLLSAADPMNRSNTLTQMAERLGTVPLWFHPGEKWAYGLSVDVQAFLVERISGQKFDRYVQDHIFTPLRMRETRYYVPESDRARFAAMYQRSDSGVLRRVSDETARAFKFFWDGAASTLFWVDPVNRLTAVLFVQLVPYDRVQLHKSFRDAVYGRHVPAAGDRP